MFYLSTKQSSNNKHILNSKSIDESPISLDKATVEDHVDGDTVVIKFENGVKEKVRFIGVNTPETVHPTKGVEAYGKESSNFTKENLLGKTIYIEKDISERDKYDRLLRYVWVQIPKKITEQEIRNKMFNATLVLEGYAQVSTFPPDVKYVDYFIEFQREAREQNRGFWGLDAVSTDAESNFKPIITQNNHGLIKGNINSKGEKIYHIPTGEFYNKTTPEAWFNTEDEAKSAGFRKSIK